MASSSSSSETATLRNIADVARRITRLFGPDSSSKPCPLPPHTAQQVHLSLALPNLQSLNSRFRGIGLASPLVERLSQEFLGHATQLKDAFEQNALRACREAKILQNDQRFAAIRLAYTGRYERLLDSWIEAIVRKRDSVGVSNSSRDHKLPDTATEISSRDIPTLALESSFTTNPYPTREEKKALAQQTGMEFKQVHDWFQNRRNKCRRLGVTLTKIEQKIASSPESIQFNVTELHMDEKGVSNVLALPAVQVVSPVHPIVTLLKEEEPADSPASTLLALADGRAHAKVEESGPLEIVMENADDEVPAPIPRFAAEAPEDASSPFAIQASLTAFPAKYNSNTKPSLPFEHFDTPWPRRLSSAVSAVAVKTTSITALTLAMAALSLGSSASRSAKRPDIAQGVYRGIPVIPFRAPLPALLNPSPSAQQPAQLSLTPVSGYIHQHFSATRISQARSATEALSISRGTASTKAIPRKVLVPHRHLTRSPVPRKPKTLTTIPPVSTPSAKKRLVEASLRRRYSSDSSVSSSSTLVQSPRSSSSRSRRSSSTTSFTSVSSAESTIACSPYLSSPLPLWDAKDARAIFFGQPKVSGYDFDGDAIQNWLQGVQP